MKYSLILADPPWSYGNTISNGAADNHYETMPVEDIKRLPVWSLAADDSVLAMWYTGNFVQEAQDVAEAWGFNVRQMFLFTWVKFTEQAERTINTALSEMRVSDYYDVLELLDKVTRMNGGNYSRQNQESVLIAVRGKGLKRLSASVKQIVYSPISKHSAKPGEVRYRLEQMYGDVPRIELFSREYADGWDHWGNQAPSRKVDIFPASFQMHVVDA